MRASEQDSFTFSESKQLKDCGWQENVKEFIFPDTFQEEITVWPTDLKAIIMSKGTSYNYMIEKFKLHDDIRVVFDSFYRTPLRNLSPGLKIIIFGHSCNYSIDDLPDSVEYIQLGYRFDQPIHKFPASLKYIRFDHDYTHDIVLPYSESDKILVEVSTYYDGNIINESCHEIKYHVID